MDLRQELLHLLAEKAYLYSPDKPFRLASGKISDNYINCKRASLDPRAMRLIGELFFEQISTLHPDAVGGVVAGACPIVDALVYTSEIKGQPVQGFYVRKERKEHGTKELIEGDVSPRGKIRVIIVDDVITSGGSILEGIARLSDFNPNVDILKVIVLVDREEGGAGRIREAGFDFDAIFTKSELRQARVESERADTAGEFVPPRVAL
jgi:orotate phosphoribosyltransferase